MPNHTLFAERIYNLSETTGAVHEFIFSFNIFGDGSESNVSLLYFLIFIF